MHWWSVAVLLLGFSIGSYHANLLTNPGFETPVVNTDGYHAVGQVLDGWTVTDFSTPGGAGAAGGSVQLSSVADASVSPDALPDGTQALRLNSLCATDCGATPMGTTLTLGVQQILAGLTPNTQYRLTLWATGSLQIAAVQQGTVRVVAGGSTLLDAPLDVGSAALEYGTWQPFNLQFTTGASVATASLSVMSAACHCVTVDDVVLTPAAGASAGALWFARTPAGTDHALHHLEYPAGMALWGPGFPFSFTMWTRRARVPDAPWEFPDHTMVSQGEGQYSTPYAAYRGSPYGDYLAFGWKGQDDDAITNSSVGRPFEDFNEWHHWAFVYDGCCSKVIYRDGGDASHFDVFSYPRFRLGLGHIWIGAASDRADASGDFVGLLDDLCLYDHALTQEEVVAAVQDPTTVTGLLSALRFDNPNDPLHDSSAANTPAVAVGSPAVLWVASSAPTDVNECGFNNGFCDPLVTCTNTPTGRECGTCPDGFGGSGDAQCIACTFPCVTCGLDWTVCASCADGYYYDGAGGCVACQCGAGEFVTLCEMGNQQCAPCANWPCAPGFYQTGEACAGFVDTQTCAECSNGGAAYACSGATPFATGAACAGDGFADTQQCSVCAVELSGCEVCNANGTRCVTCDTGLQPSADGVACNDVNECATNGGGCGDGQTCLNLRGSRACTYCSPGFNSAGFAPCPVHNLLFDGGFEEVRVAAGQQPRLFATGGHFGRWNVSSRVEAGSVQLYGQSEPSIGHSYPEGTQVVYLNTQCSDMEAAAQNIYGEINQVFTLAPSTTYSLTLWATARFVGASAQHPTFDVYMADTDDPTFTYFYIDNFVIDLEPDILWTIQLDSWLPFSRTFTTHASTTSATIWITAYSGNCVAIDNIVIVPMQGESEGSLWLSYDHMLALHPNLTLAGPENPYTVMAWVRQDRIPFNLFPLAAFISQGSYPRVPDQNVYMGFQDASLVFSFWQSDVLTGANYQDDITQWHHYAFAFDGVATRTIYRDGVVVWNETIGSYASPEGQIIFGTSAFLIDLDNYFQGEIDSVRFYNRVLHPHELGPASYAPQSVSGLLAAHDFDTPADLTLDASGTGHTGELRDLHMWLSYPAPEDFNECATNKGFCDPTNLGVCTNTFGSYVCGCAVGYRVSSSQNPTCLDVNECASVNGGCDMLTTCTNTQGSRLCSACPAGYTGDATQGCTPSSVGLTSSSSSDFPAYGIALITVGCALCVLALVLCLWRRRYQKKIHKLKQERAAESPAYVEISPEEIEWIAADGETLLTSPPPPSVFGSATQAHSGSSHVPQGSGSVVSAVVRPNTTAVAKKPSGTGTGSSAADKYDVYLPSQVRRSDQHVYDVYDTVVEGAERPGGNGGNAGNNNYYDGASRAEGVPLLERAKPQPPAHTAIAVQAASDDGDDIDCDADAMLYSNNEGQTAASKTNSYYATASHFDSPPERKTGGAVDPRTGMHPLDMYDGAPQLAPTTGTGTGGKGTGGMHPLDAYDGAPQFATTATAATTSGGQHKKNSPSSSTPAGSGSVLSSNKSSGASDYFAIGEGFSAVVYKARWHGAEVAVKFMRNQSDTPKNLDRFNLEITTSRNIPHHPRLVPFFGACKKPGCLALVFALMEAGSVEEVLIYKQMWQVDPEVVPDDSQRQRNWRIVIEIAVDASSALIHCHYHGLIHRDVRAANFLIKTEEGTYHGMISDFGLSRSLPKGAKSHIDKSEPIPIQWSAPEAIIEGVFSEATDVFMFGMFLFELIVRQPPHNEFTARAFTRLGPSQIKTRRPVLPDWTPPELADLIKRTWQPDPAQRPDIKTVNRELSDYLRRSMGRQAYYNRPDAAYNQAGAAAYNQPAAEGVPAARGGGAGGGYMAAIGAGNVAPPANKTSSSSTKAKEAAALANKPAMRKDDVAYRSRKELDRYY